MERKDFYNDYKYFIAIVLISTLLWAVIINSMNESINRKKESYLNSEIESFESKLEATIETYEAFSKYIFQNLVTQDVLELLHKAYLSNYEDVDQYRSELYQSLAEDYNQIINYDFRQLHFHTNHGDSFLRFHSPEQYGDNLIDVRDSIKLANQDHIYVSGFEEGRIFNGYRFVYPLSYQETHIGTVEVSLSMSAIISILYDLYPNEDLFFVIKKDLVEETVFEDQQSHYTESFFSVDYMFDKEVLDVFIKNSNKFGLSELEVYLKEVSTAINQELLTKKPFVFVSEFQDNYYMLVFTPVISISGNTSGYLISFYQNDLYHSIYGGIASELVLISIIFLIFFLGTYIFTKDRIKLNRISNYDNLTEVPNRHKLKKDAENEMYRAKRYFHCLAVIVFDIDNFKNINDTYGHNTGDIILKELAQVVSSNIRRSDTLARWGGEEFVILTPETSLSEATILAEKLRTIISNHTFSFLESLTCSFGIAVYDGESEIEAIIDKADKAMYQAKVEGKNRVRIYKDS